MSLWRGIFFEYVCFIRGIDIVTIIVVVIILIVLYSLHCTTFIIVILLCRYCHPKTSYPVIIIIIVSYSNDHQSQHITVVLLYLRVVFNRFIHTTKHCKAADIYYICCSFMRTSQLGYQVSDYSCVMAAIISSYKPRVHIDTTHIHTLMHTVPDEELDSLVSLHDLQNNPLDDTTATKIGDLFHQTQLATHIIKAKQKLQSVQ